MYFTGKIKNYCIVACFFVFLTACSPGKNTAKPTILSPEAQVSDWDQLKLYQQDTWSMTGKISIQFQGQVQIGNLVWHQKGDQYHILLYGPAGFGGARIQGDSHHVTLKSERGLQEAQSPECLIKALYGWDLPVSSLEFWVKALPMPFDPFEMDATAEGLPRELRQNNWSIVYSEYIVTQGIVLPSRIKLNNPLMKITIKVQHWDL